MGFTKKVGAMSKYSVAIVGATGAVGEKMLNIVEERGFPARSLRLLASERSAGSELKFQDELIPVERLNHDSFRGVDFALFSAGAEVSRKYAPLAAAEGAIVIDNSSAFRMEEEVPLVVPEVNPQDLENHKGIIANPNCSTIQMVVVLKPLYDYSRIKRIVVSTYQSVSGTGWKAIKELQRQARAVLDSRPAGKPEAYPVQIAFNLIPHIDVFDDKGYTKEEMKMIHETRKIMHDPEIRITATTVRVPVFYAHSEAVNIETEKKITAQKARELLEGAPGVEVMDDFHKGIYPTPIDAEGRDECFVGRIREDDSVPNGLNLWIVADNLRKGAALNAVQIMELLAY